MAYRIIESFTDGDVEDYRSLKGNQGQFKKGIFIAESPKIVEIVLESQIEVVSAFLTPEYFEKYQALLDARSEETLVYLTSKSAIEQVVGYHLHQGVMLACRIPQPTPLAEFRSSRSPFLVVALDGIADAENMGAIIRNCAAFDIDAILIDDRSCNPYLRRSVRVSMGTIVHTRFIIASSLADALKELKLRGATVIGASLATEHVKLEDVNANGDVVAVFGSEGWGLREEVVAQCELVAAIPISDKVDSLNVGIANGIFLYSLRSILRKAG